MVCFATTASQTVLGPYLLAKTLALLAAACLMWTGPRADTWHLHPTKIVVLAARMASWNIGSHGFGASRRNRRAGGFGIYAWDEIVGQHLLNGDKSMRLTPVVDQSGHKIPNFLISGLSQTISSKMYHSMAPSPASRTMAH
jgi:hypothetical protein